MMTDFAASPMFYTIITAKFFIAPFHVSLLLLQLGNLFLHSLGCYLLVTLYRNGEDTVQRLLVINLSITEALLSCLGAIETLSEIICRHSESTSAAYVDGMVSTFESTGIVFVYFLTMYYVTFDRLLAIYLNIKYGLYCNEYRAKKLLTATWLCGVAVSLSITSVCNRFTGKIEMVFHLFIYPP